MFHIANDALVVLDFFQHFASTQEALLGRRVVAQMFVQPAQRVSLALGVGGDPDVRHAPAVDQLLQNKVPEPSGLGRVCGARFPEQAKHADYLSRNSRTRHSDLAKRGNPVRATTISPRETAWLEASYFLKSRTSFRARAGRKTQDLVGLRFRLDLPDSLPAMRRASRDAPRRIGLLALLEQGAFHQTAVL
jgi:hypothetical protein